MPRFKLNDPIFEGFNFESDFQSKLPSGTIRDIPGLLKKDFSFGYFTNFSRIARYSTGFIGNQFGLPDYGIDNFAKNNIAKLFENAGLVTPDLVNSLIAQGVTLGIQAALQAILTNIPVVGPILQMGFRAFSLLIAAVSKQQEPANVPEDAKVYDGEQDQSLADYILQDLRGEDWTPLFLPTCGNNCTWSTSEVSWVGAVPGGRRFSVPEGSGRGLLPGIADQAGYYQYPYYDPGAFGLPTWLPRVQTSGDLHPTAQQLSLYIWQLVNKPSANMFRLDFSSIQMAWRDYYASLFEWAESQKNTLLRFQGISAASYTNCFVEDANYKWKDVCTKMSKSGVCVGVTKTVDYTTVKGKLNCAGAKDEKWNSLIANIPGTWQGPPDLMGELIFSIIHQYASRLKPTLSTIVCAYVPPNAPAFKSVPWLKDYYHEMRQLLLQHPAKQNVELDLIPDAAYRNAMYVAQKQGGVGVSISTGPRIAGLPTIDPNPPPLPPAPPQGLPPGTPSPTVESVRKNWVFYAAALGALGYVGYQQGWLDKLKRKL